MIIKLSTTEAVCADLDQLVATGYFGKSRAEAAEQLIRNELIRRHETDSFDRLVDRARKARKR